MCVCVCVCVERGSQNKSTDDEREHRGRVREGNNGASDRTAQAAEENYREVKSCQLKMASPVLQQKTGKKISEVVTITKKVKKKKRRQKQMPSSFHYEILI